MQRGSLIIYDNTGKIWAITGDAQGDILPHVYPENLPYIETQYGELDGKIVIGVDLTTHTLITEDILINQEPLVAQITLEELKENQLILMDAIATLFETIITPV